MTARLYCKDTYKNNYPMMTKSTVMRFLQDNNIMYGVDDQAIQLLLTKMPIESFPYAIAKGKPVEHGENGEMKYVLDVDTVFDRSTNRNFRDVMRIPSVEKGQKIATLVPPTNGTDGIDVRGNRIKAMKGKSVTKKTGKNVVYRETDNSFYATDNGQVSVSGRYIHVHPVYEVDETLSMKNGNLDFVGTIVIRGDIPSGFTVKAGGDVKIYGLVEAATVVAGGSIYVSGGLSGQKKGKISAAENVHIGYINQGIVNAGNNLFVENSIIHSNCVAKNHVYCQQGNILGGCISTGKSIEAKDIGNRLSTKTEITLGVNKSIVQQEDGLKTEKKELQQTLVKLEMLGKKLIEQDHIPSNKLRLTMLRQRNAYQKVKSKLKVIEDKLQALHPHLGSLLEAKLIVRNNIYSNVTVSIGKYRRMMKSDYHYIQMYLNKNEIVIEPLFK